MNTEKSKPIKKKQIRKLFFFNMVLVLTSLNACETLGDPDPEEPTYPPATTILRVELTPDTLVQGDTLTLKCVVKDSLDPNLRFDWSLSSTRIIPVNGRTDQSVVKWHTGDSDYFMNLPDSIEISGPRSAVYVDKIHETVKYEQVVKNFTIYIKRKPN